MRPYDKKWKRVLATTLLVFAGNSLLAFLVAAFIIPHDIVMGGTTGIGIVLGKALHVDTSVFILILNVILLIAGLIFLGKKLFMTTIASSLLYPLLLAGMQRIPGIDSMTDDHLLAALFAGVLMGIALGLVMRVGASTGGTDIICLILQKKTHLPLALFINLTDVLIVGGQALFIDPEKTLLGILVIVLETLVLDRVMLLGQAQLQVTAVSVYYEQVREALLHDLEAGLTMVHIETGFLSQNQKGIICVIPPRKLYQATELILRIDPEAFITVTKINEVRGRGFTAERLKLDRNERN